MGQSMASSRSGATKAADELDENKGWLAELKTKATRMGRVRVAS